MRKTRATSREAYSAIKDYLPLSRLKVLKAIKKCVKGVSLFELVEILEKPINEISGRVTELANQGKIIDCGRKLNPRSKRSCTLWKVV